MCRMLALRAPTYKEAQELLTKFRTQAEAGKKEPGDPEPKGHVDGWGLVAFAPGQVRYLARRPKSAAQDDYFERALEMLKNTPKDAGYFCHLRRASEGGAKLENTHPFIAGGWAFGHNGTIKGHLDDPGIDYQGDTDSERFFRKLLKHMKVQPTFEDALRRCIAEIEAHSRYTSLLFILTNGDDLYGYVRIGQDLKDSGRSKEDLAGYYKLGWGRVGKATVVAQERTHLGEFDEWNVVPDDHLLIWQRGQAPRIEPLGLISATASSE